MTTNPTKIAGEDMTDEQIRKSMTGEQIRLERKLTCEAIDGAMAFGYQNTNPPLSDDHWLAPYWKIGRQQAEMDAGLLASKAAVAEGWKLVPVRMTASMINAWSGGSTVGTDEVAYRTPFQEAWKRVLAAAPAAPAKSCGDAEQADARSDGEEADEARLPEGWKLVPVEPTEGMFKAADEAMEKSRVRCAGDEYEAMLRSAPEFSDR